MEYNARKKKQKKQGSSNFEAMGEAMSTLILKAISSSVCSRTGHDECIQDKSNAVCTIVHFKILGH